MLSKNSVAAQAYYKIKAEGKIVYSEEAFNEFLDVFIRPKFDRYLSLDARLMVIRDLRAIIEIVPVKTTINLCRDPRDNKFLELAIESNAYCIITGDNDLLVLNPFQNIPILTAADF